MVLELRRRLTDAGLDAGADTLVWHLHEHHRIELSRATVYRILRRAGVIVPAPAKRPKSSYIRFQADQPNECWQADFTHHRLADGSDTEILCWIDDHSRYALSVTAHRRVTGPIVVNAFTSIIERHGTPSSTLTDNGMVFTTRLSGGRGGRNAYEHLLDSLGVIQKNSRPTTRPPAARSNVSIKHSRNGYAPNHPPPRSPTCNTNSTASSTPTTTTDHTAPSNAAHRPRSTPPAPKPPPPAPTKPTTESAATASATATSHCASAAILHHIGIGRHLHRTPIIMLVDDLDVRVIHATTGETIRTLTIDPNRRYHGTGKPIGGPKRPPETKNPNP